jgi:hypothetical protein
MGYRLASSGSTTILGSPIVTNAETVICTTGFIILPVDNTPVILLWRWSITTAAATTSFQTRLRVGTTTAGTQVNQTDIMVPTAAQTNATGGGYLHQPGIAGPLQYSISVQSTAAGANHTVVDVCLIAMVL